MEELINSGIYDVDDQFTVVFQPFMDQGPVKVPILVVFTSSIYYHLLPAPLWMLQTTLYSHVATSFVPDWPYQPFIDTPYPKE